MNFSHFLKFTTSLQNLEEPKSSGTGTVGLRCFQIKTGKIAAATSTGGKGFEVPGRISDSATVAGNYANPFCGVSLTGGRGYHE
jgi:L-asparaginase